MTASRSRSSRAMPRTSGRIGKVLRDQGLRLRPRVTVLPDEAHTRDQPGRRPSRAGRGSTGSLGGRLPAGLRRHGAGRAVPPAARACSPATRRPRPSWAGWSRCTSRPADYAARAAARAVDRAAQPVRVLRAEHRGRRGGDRAAGRPAQFRPALRHLPRQHRGEGPDRRDRGRTSRRSTTSTSPRTTAARPARGTCRWP